MITSRRTPEYTEVANVEGGPSVCKVAAKVIIKSLVKLTFGKL
jgi:hypothetical protein